MACVAPQAADPALPWGRLAALLLAGLLALPAQGADALRGKTLYASTPGGTSCANSSCHGANPSQNRNRVLRGANSPSTIQNAINNNTGGMGIYRNNVLTTVDVADIAAYLGNPNVTAGPIATITPVTLSFPSTAVGASSSAQTVTVSNTGSAALSISAISFTGAYAQSGGSCAAGGSVAAAGSCTIAVVFRPLAAGASTGTLTITHNASGSPGTVSLSGSGAAATPPGVMPAAMNFGSVAVGSRGTAQTATVSNPGSQAVTLGTIGTGNAQFPISGGSCASGGSLAAGGSCTVLVNFAPTAAGAASATLSIPTSAAANPLAVALSGTATAALPVAQLAPASLSLSQVVGTASAAQLLTLANTGNAPLLITSLGLSGAAASDYAFGPATTCANGGSVAAGSSCTISLVFTPAATGTRAATLSIVHNDSLHTPSTATLNGTGTAAPRGQLSVNQLALSFPAQAQGSSSAAQSVMVSNSGSASLTLATLAIAGTHAADFGLTAGSNACVAGQTLPAGANCTARIVFTPSVASGLRTASLSIGAGSAGTATVSLSGTASAPSAPILGLSPTSLDFGAVTTGMISATRTATLSNNGTAPLLLGTITASPAAFALTHDCPSSLAARARCTLSLGFTPVAAGLVSGAVTVVSNAASAPDVLALSGTGVLPAPAVLGWLGVTSLGFGDAAVGAQTAAQSLQLQNTGTAAALLQGFQLGGAAAADYLIDPASTCVSGASLAAGSSCRIDVRFAPASAGTRAATLSVLSDATAPPTVPLSGNGITGGTPVLSLSPAVIALTGAVNQPLQPQVLVLANDGPAPLHVSAIQAGSGLLLLDASMSGGGSCAPVPFTIAPGASCTLVVDPVSNRVSSAIAITSDAAAQPAQVAVSGSAITNAGAGGAAGGLLLLASALLARRRVRRTADQ